MDEASLLEALYCVVWIIGGLDLNRSKGFLQFGFGFSFSTIA